MVPHDEARRDFPVSQPDAERQWSPPQVVSDLLLRRREQVAQRWADLSLFRTVFTVSRDEAVEACRAVIDALSAVAASARPEDIEAPGFAAVREQLGRMSATRTRAGASAGQIAAEVVDLKTAVTEMVETELHDEPDDRRYSVLLFLSELLGTLRVVVMETALIDGRDLIARQRQQLMEAATPVIKLWDGIVAVPLIGTLDSARSQVVMENLLESIVAHQARVAILDITGVPTVDSLVAQHLMKTVASARLMGAECIVSGIRPAIAQIIVQLGIDLSSVVTRASLADALAMALRRTGVEVPGASLAADQW